MGENFPSVSTSNLMEDGRSSESSRGKFPLRRQKSDIGITHKSKIETSLLSFWNNVKYGWSSKKSASFSKGSPVWLLGKCYVLKHKFQSSASRRGDHGVEAFRRDFQTRFWITYRKEFPPLTNSTYTTDCGWGCMIRSAQMMLAQALVVHYIGRSWRWSPDGDSVTNDVAHRLIIKWFGDSPSAMSRPLSIHEFVKAGTAFSKRAGDWYGPASVAQMIKAVIGNTHETVSNFSDIAVVVVQNNILYINDVIEECASEDGSWKSVIILIPLKLGMEKVMNSIYNFSFTSLFSLEQCIGAIGGRPKHSLYYVGYQEDKLIYLDPHYCQGVVDVSQPNFQVNSFHCKTPRKMPLSKMDPSCCFGFYCSNRSDFDLFIANVKPYLMPPATLKANAYPMFTICSEGSSASLNKSYDENVTFRSIDESWTIVNVDFDTDIEAEEFVLM